MSRTIRVRPSSRGQRRRGHARHLYRGQGTEARELEAFEREYPHGGRHGRSAAYIYGATVGKVARERAAKRAKERSRRYRRRRRASRPRRR